MPLSSNIKSKPLGGGAAPKKPKAEKPFAPAGMPVRPSDLGIADRLYRHIAAKRAATKYVQRRVWASGINQCARQQSMAIMGFEGRVIGQDDPHWAVVAEYGVGWHKEIIEGWMTEIGMATRSEFRVMYPTDKPVVSGKVDVEHDADAISDEQFFALLEAEDAENEEGAWITTDFILDLKTVSHAQYLKGAHGDKFQSYVDQLNIYGVLTGKTLGVVLLLDRDSGKMQDILVDLDPEYGKQLLQRAEMIVTLAKTRQLAEPEKLGTRACGFCPVSTYCALQQSTGVIQSKLDEGASVADIEALYTPKE